MTFPVGSPPHVRRASTGARPVTPDRRTVSWRVATVGQDLIVGSQEVAEAHPCVEGPGCANEGSHPAPQPSDEG